MAYPNPNSGIAEGQQRLLSDLLTPLPQPTIQTNPINPGESSWDYNQRIGGIKNFSGDHLVGAQPGYTPYSGDPANAAALADWRKQDTLRMKGVTEDANIARAKNAAYDKTLMGQMDPYIKTGATLMQGVGSLANIYMGFQQLGLQKEQLSMAKDQWKEQKQELAHIRGVRSRLTAQYSR